MPSGVAKVVVPFPSVADPAGLPAGVGRDEVMVVADTAYRLFDRRVLHADKATARKVATALGITVEDIREAGVRAETRGWRNPRPGMAVREAPPPPDTTQYSRTGNATDGRKAGKERKVSGATERWCPRHANGAGAWLPVERFAIKNHRTGSRKAYCSDCMREYQRDRYLTISAARTVAAATAVLLTFRLHPDDVLVGRRCPVCSEQFDVDDEVAGETTVTHAGCVSA